jgi:hypothetical protein
VDDQWKQHRQPCTHDKVWFAHVFEHVCVAGCGVGKFMFYWRRRACCTCLRACVLACCAHAHAAGAYYRHVLGPQNDPRHEYANWSDV